MPDHAEMLERAGLAKAAKGEKRAKRARNWPPPPGRHELTRTRPDGTEVPAWIAVNDDGDIDMLLDPGTDLRVRLIKEFGEYRVRIEWGDEKDGYTEQDLDDRAPAFRAARDAVADWLRAHGPDPPGGEWAAETLGALGDAAFSG